MPAYFFFDVLEITDPEKMETYRAGVSATVEAHGGIYRVIGGEQEGFEGDWRPVFPVLIEFPTAAAARAWYESPEYSALRELRLQAMRGSAVLLHGLPPAG